MSKIRRRGVLDGFIPWEHEWREGVCWGPIDLTSCIAKAINAVCTYRGIRRVVTEDAEMYYYKRRVHVTRHVKGQKDWTRVWNSFIQWEKENNYAGTHSPPQGARGGEGATSGAIVRRPPGGGAAS